MLGLFAAPVTPTSGPAKNFTDDDCDFDYPIGCDDPVERYPDGEFDE